MIALPSQVAPDRQQAGDAAWGVRERAAWLASFRRSVAAHEPELRALIAAEIGKPTWEALTSDIMPLLAACKWLERRLPRLLRPRRLRGGAFWQVGERHWVRREPLGAVAIIATWNYPVQLLGIQLIQALGAGNRVVVKPSEHAARTQTRLMQLAADAGLPEGMLRWVAATREAGRELLAGQRFDHVVFTGSTGVGRAVAAWAAETLTPTTLELSGRDSAIVLRDADAQLAAASIWSAVTANAGQTCMAPRRVLVEEPIYGRFLAALAPLAAAARPARLISERAAAEAYEAALNAVAGPQRNGRGGRSLSGVMEPPRGRDLRPLVIVDCPAECSLARGEHFGPVVAVIPVASLREALEIHRACGQHLAVSLFTRGRAREAIDRLGASNVIINDAVRPVAHPAVALGGRGESGWGVTRGEEGLLAMTRAVYVSRTSAWLRTPTAPPPGRGEERLAALVRWWYGGGRAASQRPSPAPPAATGPASPSGPSRSTAAAREAEATRHG